jgi:hypothetical protein
MGLATLLRAGEQIDPSPDMIAGQGAPCRAHLSTGSTRTRSRASLSAPWRTSVATGIQERHVDLGPFFALGAVFLVLGIFRRSLLAVAAGIGSIWLDQRSELGRALKTRLDRALKAQIKGYARS